MLTVLVLTAQTFAATIIEAWPKASELFIPIGKTGKEISLEALAHISVKDFESVSGQKMKLTQKLSFKLAQR